ncbi:hypothetical protein D3C79_728630 [compost metagenome]
MRHVRVHLDGLGLLLAGGGLRRFSHGRYVGTGHANLLEVLLVGLGVVVEVFRNAAIDGSQQLVRLLQARDDLGQALAPFGVVDAVGLAAFDQAGELTLVAALRSLGIGRGAVQVGGALVDVGGVRGNALLVVADLLLALGVVTGRTAHQGTTRRTDGSVTAAVVTVDQGAGQGTAKGPDDGACGNRAGHVTVGGAQVLHGLVAARVVLDLGRGTNLGHRRAGAACQQNSTETGGEQQGGTGMGSREDGLEHVTFSRGWLKRGASCHPAVGQAEATTRAARRPMPGAP